MAEESQPKETVVEEVSVGGGLWMIGAVQADFNRPSKTVKAMEAGHPPGLATRNMFADLLNDADFDDGAYAEPDEGCERTAGAGSLRGRSTGASCLMEKALRGGKASGSQC